MSGTPEGRLKRRVLDYLKSLPRCFAWALSDRFHAGLPDVFAILDGVPLAIELKTPVGRVSKIQALTLSRMSAAGAVAAVARSLDDVKAIVDEAYSHSKRQRTDPLDRSAGRRRPQCIRRRMARHRERLVDDRASRHATRDAS